VPRPILCRPKDQEAIIQVGLPDEDRRWLYCTGAPELLFTDNETNFRRLYGQDSRSRYVKDGINDYRRRSTGWAAWTS
jgi:hypothetical protein